MAAQAELKLTADEFNHLSEAFNHHVVQNGFGRIDDAWKLRNVLQACGQTPTDDDIARMLPPGGGYVEFDDFVKMMETEKAKFRRPPPPDSDTIQAFVAMGGGDGDDTKGGEVEAVLLRKMVHNFNLTLDIDKLIMEVDTDQSGEISFDEFAQMFRTNESPRDVVPCGRLASGVDKKLNRRASGSRHKSIAKGLLGSPKTGILGGTQPQKALAMPSRGPAAIDSDRDDDSDGSSSASPRRHGVGLSGDGLERKACVVASGAKKTSAQTKLTRDELLEFKLKRLDKGLRRTGELGGEIPAVPALPAHIRRRREAASRRRKRKEAESKDGSPARQQRRFSELLSPTHPQNRSAFDDDALHPGADVRLELEDAPDGDDADMGLDLLQDRTRPRRYHASSSGLTRSLRASMRARANRARPQTQAVGRPLLGMSVMRRQLDLPSLPRPSTPADGGWAYTGLDPGREGGGQPPLPFSGAAASEGGVHNHHRRLLAQLLAVPESIAPGIWKGVRGRGLGRAPGEVGGVGARSSHGTVAAALGRQRLDPLRASSA